MSTASILKFARRRSGVTQKALAEKVGLVPSYISRLETGKHEPSKKLFDELIKTLETWKQ